MIDKYSLKTLSIDIDGTLCENTFGAYEEAIPIEERIRKINRLYEKGNIINLYSARGTTTGIDWSDLTTKQLKKWGVKYHSLKLGKPEADLYIDDKAVNAYEFFYDDLDIHIEEHINAVKTTFNSKLFKKLEFLAIKIKNSIENNGKLILAGNGGSYSDCLHLSAEFTGRFINDRRPLPSIVLGINGSSMSAISNDSAFSECFSRELKALGNNKDIFIAFSTSGSSENILKCLEVSKKIGIYSVLITSDKLNNLDIADLILKVKSKTTSTIQEVHIMIIHYICRIVESKMGF